jgi:hypothetical protein
VHVRHLLPISSCGYTGKKTCIRLMCHCIKLLHIDMCPAHVVTARSLLASATHAHTRAHNQACTRAGRHAPRTCCVCRSCAGIALSSFAGAPSRSPTPRPPWKPRCGTPRSPPCLSASVCLSLCLSASMRSYVYVCIYMCLSVRRRLSNCVDASCLACMYICLGSAPSSLCLYVCAHDTFWMACACLRAFQPSLLHSIAAHVRIAL